MAEAISLRGLVQRTPEEALAYLQQKDQRITWNYWEMRGEAHARSFTVAKAARLDILSDIRQAVEKAVAEGETERWFTKDLEPVLRKKGWWGKQVDVDPDTGEAQLYQAGSYRRLQTIYRTNMQTAYMAGRWKQFEAEKARAPFVQYLAVRDARTRPSHAAMHGKVFRIDDPAWQAIAPPNGFNCVPGETLVRAQAKLGLKTWYTGQMVELETRLGYRLTITANHPILTARGWRPAYRLQEGDELICRCGKVNARLPGIVDHEHPPVPAEQLFDSLAAQGFRVIPMAANDFHGDARLRKPEIHVAGADRHLVNEIEPTREQLSGKLQLGMAHIGLGMHANGTDSTAQSGSISHNAVNPKDAADIAQRGAELARDGALGYRAVAVKREHAPLQMVIAPAGSLMGGSDLPRNPRRILPDHLPLHTLGFGTTAQLDAAQSQETPQRVSAASRLFSQLLETLPGLVELDEIVQIRQFDWSGHVYDFATETGLIMANGVIVSNCRCRARNLSEKEVERRGLKVENDVRLHEREASGQPPVDKRTGETLGEWRQRGISIPDPARPGERVYLWADQGWDYNPGDAWARTDKGGLWPDCQDGGSDFAAKGDCLGVLRGQKTWRSYGRLDLRDPGIRRQDAPQLVDRTATRGEALAVLEVALGVTAARPTRIVQTPVEPVIIAHPWLSHVIEKEADGRERFANFILPTLEDPFEVWNVRYADGGLRRRYIGLFTGRHDLMVIVRENEDGSLLWNALQADPKRMNKLRIGALLYGK